MERLEAALDPEVIARLRELAARSRPSLLTSLRETYLTDGRRRLAALSTAVADADPATLRDVAHALKGSSATLGANRLAEFCRQLEELGRSGTAAGGELLLAQVSGEFEQVAIELCQLAGEGSQ